MDQKLPNLTNSQLLDHLTLEIGKEFGIRGDKVDDPPPPRIIELLVAIRQRLAEAENPTE